MRTVAHSRAGHLPAELTSFVGRREASAEVKVLVRDSPLVTLTGQGGVGKTRLALHVARETRRVFPDGVHLVELAKLDDPDMVVHAVAAALTVPDRSARDPLTVLVEFLADKQLLIVLDNCEHVLDAAGALVSAVLPGAPKVRMVATSREPLGVAGEQVFPVPPLTVPRPDPSHGERSLPGGGVGDREAMHLFEQRAAAVVPDFRLNRENELAVARLCQRLDGLPLAIELAAVRLRVLSVEEILQRLEDRFRLLTTGFRGVSARHQTLRAAVGWSFDLCTPTEQVLWARLSVFPGAFDLDAVEQVCAGAGLAWDAVLDATFGLVHKSVLIHEERAGATRYRMVETIRQYGRERLAARDEKTLLLRRHRDYCLAMAEQAESEWFGPQQRVWLQRFREQGPDIWVALEFCCTEPGEARAGLRLVGVLWFYWVACGFVRDGRHWLDRLLALSHEPSGERVRALWVAGWVALVQGDLRGAERILQECVDLASAAGDQEDMAYAHQFLGCHAAFRDDMARAVELQERALAQHCAVGKLISPALFSFVWLSLVHLGRGDVDRAATLAEEGMSVCEQAGDEWMLLWMRWALGAARRVAGALPAAEEEARAALRLAQSFDDLVGTSCGFELLAEVAMDQGDAARAARLFGASEPLWKLMGGSPLQNAQYMLRWHHDCAQRARKTLGDRGYDEAFQQGTQLEMDEAVRYALGERAAVGTPSGSSGAAQLAHTSQQLLSRREWEVAMLVAQGLSNKEIASRLVISRRTAETHVLHILTKLSATSRTEIAAWATEQQAPGNE